MTEFAYVTLPSERSAHIREIEADATVELNRTWVSQGWEPLTATRVNTLTGIGFLLRRSVPD